jgi:hypothetical protein
MITSSLHFFTTSVAAIVLSATLSVFISAPIANAQSPSYPHLSTLLNAVKSDPPKMKFLQLVPQPFSACGKKCIPFCDGASPRFVSACYAYCMKRYGC